MEQITYTGAALARHEGRVIFVPYALPGERVHVRVPDGNKQWSEAALLEILEPSAERVEPPCPHFGPGKCSGCQMQHASYEAQLRYKQAVVREQFQRIGKIADAPVLPCLGMAEPWHYRNHVQLRATPDGLGFVQADNQGIYPLDLCLLMNEALQPMFEAVKGRAWPGVERLLLRGSRRTGEQLAIIEGKGAQALAVALPESSAVVQRAGHEGLRVLRGRAHYHEQVGGRIWRIHANSFFQVNTEQAEQLLATVWELAGPLRGTETVVDGYAGVGLFGISLAPQVGRVFLVESHPTAVADAHYHAAGQANIKVVPGTTETILPRWSRYGPPPDLVLLDPPRAGCKAAVLQALGEMRVPTIIYVACDPTTQARDIRQLLDRGYTLEVVQPVDLFPQTYHIESVARLRGPSA